ncbi:MAG: tRNA (N(6)-L-threonylcarbamoyladenosine(37)-C(2))-methylthiotransferase MtaB [Spirochaetales bacterium]|nr:tRNA (N(6)-L-threonylcarbamoyladenosine(37)-C(2))-methylthiotransferase MtaB [Spirochaetales bacterium]
MRIGLYTLGCKLNQSETEAFSSVLKKRGCTLVSIHQKADFYIINTCTVTTKSEQKARRVIRSCVNNNRNAVVIVTGCYAQMDPEVCADLDRNIVIISQDKKDKLLDFFKTVDYSCLLPLTPSEQGTAIINFINRREIDVYNPFAFFSVDFQFHSRAFLKIQDGCNSGCTYCRVPLARGTSVSLDPVEVFHRITLIDKAGYNEIVLTGVNISAYHHSGTGFSELLQKILAMKTKIRFRLSSLEPESIDKELAEIVTHPRVCPHFHIPVQSGSDRILKVMKRRYNPEKVYQAVELFRKTRPDCFLGADILTGFPGESDKDHQLSVDLINRCSFSRLHVFQFSPRPGTEAFTIKQKVPGMIIKARSQELITLSEILHSVYNALWVNREVDVVLEKKLKSGENGMAIYTGVSGNYLRLKVTDIPEEHDCRGTLVHCRILEPGIPGTAKFLSC